MTKDEAILTLCQIKGYFRSKRVGEAVDMAIESLLDRDYGKWLLSEDDGLIILACSECGEEYIQLKEYSLEIPYSYCPNCGERMEKGKITYDKNTNQLFVAPIEETEEESED